MAQVAQLNDTPLTPFESTSQCKFTKPEFVSVEDLKLSKLTNSIHPLFDTPLREVVPEYSVVEPSARLASHLLECGALDRLLLAVANDGKPGKSWKSISTSKVGLEIPLDSVDGEGQDDSTKIRALLSTLGNSLSYTLDSDITDHAMTESCPSKEFEEPGYENAERSIIKISQTLYKKLEAARNRADVLLVLQLQLTLAVTLVHELGHAVDNLAHGKLDYFHFIGDGIAFETGYEVELRLFGGCLDMLFEDKKKFKRYYYDKNPSASTGILVLWEYPYQACIQSYRSSVGIETRAEVTNFRPFDVAWRVPMSYVARLFQDDFWSKDVASNLKAFRPQCDAGYCFRSGGNGEPIPVYKADNDREMLYVPPGYDRQRDGSIVRDRNAMFGFVDPTAFWRQLSEKYVSGELIRPWRATKRGAYKTHRLCQQK